MLGDEYIQQSFGERHQLLSVNKICERYGNDKAIRIYFRASDIQHIASNGNRFSVAKPIAIRIDDRIEDEGIDFKFVLKNHTVKGIELTDYQYWMLDIKPEVKTFIDKDGIEQLYHPSKALCVCNPKAISQLDEYGMRADGLDQFNGDHI